MRFEGLGAIVQAINVILRDLRMFVVHDSNERNIMIIGSSD